MHGIGTKFWNQSGPPLVFCSADSKAKLARLDQVAGQDFAFGDIFSRLSRVIFHRLRSDKNPVRVDDQVSFPSPAGLPLQSAVDMFSLRSKHRKRRRPYHR